jgi:hypothetical protein
MILSYVDILGDGERHNIRATITTEHPNSSYGQPVLLLEDGKPLNAESWFLMAYQVVNANHAEFEMLKQWINTIAFLLQIPASAAAATLGSKGGSVNSEKQNKARANNGRQFGGRKKGSKNRPKGNDEA